MEDNDFMPTIRDMAAEKAVQGPGLIWILILQTHKALTEGGPNAERAVRGFRSLLLLVQDAEFATGDGKEGSGSNGRWKQLRELKDKYKSPLDAPKYYAEAEDILFKEFDALLSLTKRRGLIKMGRGKVETIGKKPPTPIKQGK